MSKFDTSQYMAAVKLQSRVRMKRARRQFKEKVTERQYRLRYFAWPIFITSLGDILGQTLIADRIDRQELGPEWALYSVAFCTLPCIIVLIIDLAKPRHAPTMAKRRPRFSLAHGIFLVGVLGRLATRAATIDAARGSNRSNARLLASIAALHMHMPYGTEASHAPYTHAFGSCLVLAKGSVGLHL